MFTIPENWKSFEAADLRSLATQIREALEAAKAAGEMSADDFAEANALVKTRKEILALAAEKEAFAAAELSEDEEAAPPVVEETKEEASDDATEDLGDEDDADDSEDETESDEDEEVEASVKPKVRTSTGVSTTEDDTQAGASTPDHLIAKGGVTSKPGGETFTDWAELAASLMEAASNLSPGSSVKVPVATAQLSFDDEHTLGDNLTQNLRKFDKDLTAAFCAPTINTYDGVLACMNTDRRPVRGSLSVFTPSNRGSVSIFPAPSLADITDQDGGYGIWDTDDDDSQTGTNPSIKECALVECATPTVYQLYALWRCLTVQNLLWMTFPELVEAYLNRLAAAHARLAETTLLEAMGTAAIEVTQSDLGYGTTSTVTSTIMNMLALAVETERWDDQGMEMWAPRWLKVAMKMDIVRRRRTDGGVSSIPGDGAIDAMFRDAGVNPHWFIDSPSWSPVPPAVQTGGVLNLLPSSVGVVIAPTGKFAVMDRGELNIGVTGNNMYRDNASNSKNQFTWFFENFEALVNTDSCPAYLLTIEDLCHNGIQIADERLLCNGNSTAS